MAFLALCTRVLSPSTPTCSSLLHTPLAHADAPIALGMGTPTLSLPAHPTAFPSPALLWCPPPSEVLCGPDASPPAFRPSPLAPHATPGAVADEASSPAPTGRDPGTSGDPPPDSGFPAALCPGEGCARTAPRVAATPDASPLSPQAGTPPAQGADECPPLPRRGGPPPTPVDTGGTPGGARVECTEASAPRGEGHQPRAVQRRGVAGDSWGLSPNRAAALAEPWMLMVHTMSPAALFHTCCTGGAGGEFLVPLGPSLPLPFFDARVFKDEEDPAVAQAWSHPFMSPRDDRIQSSPGYKLIPDAWARVFANHPHGGALYEWARFGMPALCSLTPHQARRTPNSSFTPRARAETAAWVTEELSTGKTVRVPRSHSGPLMISPLCTVPKPGSNKLRVCHNLSAPFGHSVNANSSFSPHCEPMTLSSVIHLAKQGRFARSFRGVAFIAKVDIKSCYRNFPLRARDWWLHGLEWAGERLAHVFVIWGGKPAAHLISLVTQAICDVLQPQFPDCDVSVYLDDFHIVGRSAERVWEVVRALRVILSALGIEEAVDKFVAPSDCAISLGTQFDLRHGHVCVVPERAAKLREKISHILSTPSSRRDIESLTGSLLFISPLFPNARLRLVCLWRWLAEWDLHPAFTQLPTAECRLALAWWLSALHPATLSCGVSLDTGIDRPISTLCGIASDSCDFGFAWYSESLQRYIAGKWSQDEFRCMSSNLRELFALVMGVVTHAPLLSGLVVYVDTDSSTAYYAVTNQGSDRVAYRLLVAVLLWAAEFFRFVVIPRHLPGLRNQVADALSRLRWPDEWLACNSSGVPIHQLFTATPISWSLRNLLHTACSPCWQDGQALEHAARSHPFWLGTTSSPSTDAVTSPCSEASYARSLRDLWPVFY